MGGAGAVTPDGAVPRGRTLQSALGWHAGRPVYQFSPTGLALSCWVPDLQNRLVQTGQQTALTAGGGEALPVVQAGLAAGETLSVVQFPGLPPPCVQSASQLRRTGEIGRAAEEKVSHRVNGGNI